MKNPLEMEEKGVLPDTRDTKCFLKWVLVRIAAFCCARWPQIWIPEIEYYQKVVSHAQIWPQGAKKSCCGGWRVVGEQS